MASNTNLVLGDLSILYEGMIVNLKEEVKFLKEQLVLKDNYFREESVLLRKKLDIALSHPVNNSHTHDVSQYSSNIEYREDDNTQSDFHQQDQLETVINTTPDICDQDIVTVNPQIEKNNEKRVNPESCKGTLAKNQKTKNQRTL